MVPLKAVRALILSPVDVVVFEELVDEGRPLARVLVVRERLLDLTSQLPYHACHHMEARDVDDRGQEDIISIGVERRVDNIEEILGFAKGGPSSLIPKYYFK